MQQVQNPLADLLLSAEAQKLVGKDLSLRKGLNQKATV